jgi:DMSO/TMAO reductase YedYZ molybdopterin-dependent catalytic subunit
VSAITRPFCFNAYYPVWETRMVPEDWRLAVTGLVAHKTPWTVDRLRGLPQQAQITRHICIEGSTRWRRLGRRRRTSQHRCAQCSVPRPNLRVLLGEVTGVDPALRQIVLGETRLA